MKKSAGKQMITIAGGVLACSMQMMGCYPLAPAYFAAAFLEGVNGVWLTAAMYIGMLYFMPLTATVKYAVALLVTAGAIKLVEWANEGCPAFLAAILTAITTMILSFCGGLLEWKDQPEVLAVFLEGIFVFGAVILLNRGIHFFMEWQGRGSRIEQEPVDRGKEERLSGYAESFQGLSQIFMNMSKKKEQYTAEELGQMQNELTGRLCANCDCCAICWEQESTPLYGILSNMITSILNVGIPAKESEEELSHYCKHSKDMVEEAVRVFEKASLNRAWYNRLLENRQTIAEQLDAMAYIMKDCAKEEKLLDTQEKKALAEIRYRAKESGIVIEEMHLYENQEGRLRLTAGLRSKMGRLCFCEIISRSGQPCAWKRYPCCRRLPFIYLKGTHRFFVLRGYKIPQCAGNRTAEKRRCTDFRGQFLVSGAGARRSSARTLGWHGLRQCRMQRE